MAIPNIANIRVGLPNESVDSDSLYTAFTKTRDNFNTIANLASPYNTFTGNGVSVNANSEAGTVEITNTGVTSIVAGTGVSISSANGAVTISSNGGGNGGSGTVTSVGIQSPNSTLNVSGTIVSSGNLNVDLQTVGITSGTYRAPNITVDSYGRVTSIANGNLGITSLAIIPGSGIRVEGSPANATASNITVTNTGVTRLNAGSGIALSGSNGNVTVGLTGTVGSVTSVGISSNTLVVANSPIITSGTISVNLPNAISVSGNISANFITATNRISANGISTSWGITTGNSVGALNSIMGVVNSATWLLSGTSNGEFRYGIQAYDPGGEIRFYANATQFRFVNDVLQANTLNSNGNVVASGLITATGNIQGGNLRTTGVLSVGGNANTGNLGVTGVFASTLSATGNANTGNLGATTGVFTNVTGTLTTAAQPNITSLGTLSSLTISGNAIVGNNLFVNGNLTYINVDSLQVEDPIIDLGGGPNGAALTTNDGKDRGLLLDYYTTTPVSAFMGWDNSNAEFSFGRNVSVSSEVITFNQLGNIRASTFIGDLSGTVTTASQPNITSVGTLSSLSVSANANIGNLGITGLLSATGNITGGNITTAGALNVTGNMIIGNTNISGSANNNSIITAGVFRTISGVGILPNTSPGLTLFTVYGSQVPYSKWQITIMKTLFDGLAPDPFYNLSATFHLTTNGGGYGIQTIANGGNVVYSILGGGPDVTFRVYNNITGLDAGSYEIAWSAMRLI